METTVLPCRLSGDCGRTCECLGGEDDWRRAKERRRAFKYSERWRGRRNRGTV